MKKYDKYKDSGIEWIGQVPEHWEMNKMKYLFSIVSGATPDSNNMSYWDGNVVWITPADFKTEDKYVTEGKRRLTQEGYDSCSSVLVPKGSIIFSKRAPIGSVAISSVPLCTNQGCLSLIKKGEDSELFYYYLLSILSEEFEQLGSGSTFKEISASVFGNYKLILPPLSEQEAIAAYLDEKTGQIDALMAEKSEQLKDLQTLRTSIITEAVTKGLNPNAPMKDSGIEWIGQVPEHWDMKKIKYLFSIVSGATPDSNNMNNWDGDIVWITPADFKTEDKYVMEGKRKLTQEGYDSCSSLLVPKGSIIFSKRAPIGSVAISSIPLCTNQGCLSLIKKGEDSELFYYYLLSILSEEFEQLGSGSTFKEISASVFGDYRLILPPLSEQRAIAAYLDEKTSEIDAMKAELTAQIEDLKTLRTSLITEAVTGQVDVRDWKTKH